MRDTATRNGVQKAPNFNRETKKNKTEKRPSRISKMSN